MRKHEITAVQADKVYAALVPTLGFLTQLEARLAELGFPGDDAYVVRLRAASEAYRRLTADTFGLTRRGEGAGVR
jgi:outer membrane protein assembly factor BamA